MKKAKILIIIVTIATLFACKKESVVDYSLNIDFRQEMRNFVMEIGDYARRFDTDFIVIPQNGQELITNTGYADGTLQTAYLQSINATGREDLFYGYTGDNEPTPKTENEYLLSLCNVCEQNGVEVLTVDYCSSHDKMDNSYIQNLNHGFISFAADDRNLRDIPDYPVHPFNENNNDITNISETKNFLYLINSENFATKQDFINAVSQTNYDVVIMDLFHNKEAYIYSEIGQLKTKHNGGKRLVICYMSIGEAEDYRFYWQSDWNKNKPSWLEPENPNWEGNYKVRYWEQEWKNIIYGDDNSYLKKIINAGFDGVYLDIIDAFDYFEQKYINKIV